MAILVLTLTTSCRRDYTREIGPLPSPSVAAGASPADGPAAATVPADGGAPVPRPLDRKPFPVFFRGHDVSGDFARLAPPSPEHPRGTIGVLADEGGAYDRDGPVGPWQRYFLELDLATGARVQTLPVVNTADLVEVHDGASGPIVLVWGKGGATVIWFDRQLGEVVRHSFDVPHDDDFPYVCGESAVGDRLALALCEGPHTPVWLFGADGTTIARTCPQRIPGFPTRIVAWHDDRVAVLDHRGASVCAFRLDGKGGVTSRRYPPLASLLPHRGEILLDAGDAPTPSFYALGDDLRPRGLARPEPVSPIEEVAASAFPLPVQDKTVTLVNGTIVITGINCCGGYSATHLWLLDPHAGD